VSHNCSNAIIILSDGIIAFSEGFPIKEADVTETGQWIAQSTLSWTTDSNLELSGRGLLDCDDVSVFRLLPHSPWRWRQHWPLWSVSYHNTTWRHIPEDLDLKHYRPESPKTRINQDKHTIRYTWKQTRGFKISYLTESRLIVKQQTVSKNKMWIVWVGN
jgi:hypothetical protein